MYGLRDRRTKDWFWGSKAAITRLEDDAQVAVYVALLILSGEGSIVWASQDTISSLAHCSVRTVARTLPELERLQVIQRADDATLARLAERLGEIPATIIYELVAVEHVPVETVRAPDDNRSLHEQVADVKGRYGTPGRRAAVVALVRKYLATMSKKNIDFGWLIRLYNIAQANATSYDKMMQGEATFVWAAEQTAKANPRGEWLAYMGKVINQRPDTQQEQELPDLSNETAKQFGEW